MQINDFIDKCVGKGYEWAEGEHDGKPGYFVKSEKYDTKAHFTKDAIENNDWSSLNKGIVQGKDVYHMTRVVGYYSRVHNWNKSKLGELKDRQAGEYSVK